MIALAPLKGLLHVVGCSRRGEIGRIIRFRKADARKVKVDEEASGG